MKWTVDLCALWFLLTRTKVLCFYSNGCDGCFYSSAGMDQGEAQCFRDMVCIFRDMSLSHLSFGVGHKGFVTLLLLHI